VLDKPKKEQLESKPKIKTEKQLEQPEQPKPKPEFTLNLYDCYRCRKKVHAKIIGETKNKNQILELYCSVCGDKIFNYSFQRQIKDKLNEYNDSKESTENLLENEG
jgi:transcription elongation factor Elf1